MKVLTSNSRLFSLLGHQAAVRKGRQTEDRVLDALVACQDRLPEWFVRAYATEPESHQDRKGIDYVIETNDLGKAFLQVKSSEHFARKFKLKQSKGRYNRFISVVVIPEHVTDESRIAEMVIRSVEKSRALIRAEHMKCA